MELRLPNSISSREQLESLLFELEEYLDWSRSLQIQAKVVGGSMAIQDRTWSPEIQELLALISPGKAPTLAGVEELMKELKRLKKSSPSVQVTLAGWPNSQLRQELVSWFRTNLDPSLLVSFGVNRTLIGGLAVRVGSHVFDYSWRKSLLDKRDVIPEILRRV